MTPTLHPYHSYKPSDVEWLGEVPMHWEVRRLGSILRERDETNRDGSVTEVLSVLRDRGVIPYSQKGNIGNKKSEDITRYKIVRPNDVVMNSMNVIIGSVGLSRYTGCLSPVYYVLTNRSNEDSLQYLNAIFQTKPFQRSLVRIGNGILAHRMRIPMELLKCELLPRPPLSEQRAIVRYLNHVDDRIRRYLAAKEKLIALLEEERQAVIHRAVTRGLDPNVPLKPSGVEWLGNIPAHWNVRRLGYLASKFGSGITPRGGATVYQESGVPFLRSQNVHFDGLRMVNVARIAPTLHQKLSSSHVRSGDVLLNITGASIGRTCSVPDDFVEGNVNQHVCIIRPKRNHLQPNLLAAYLSTSTLQREIQFEQSGASREGLTLQSIRNFQVVVPPLNEQAAIVEYLDKATADIDSASNRARRQIDLLREYRTRLIADVVTGKLDVREAAAQPGEQADEEDRIGQGIPMADNTDDSLYNSDESAGELAMEREVAP